MPAVLRAGLRLRLRRPVVDRRAGRRRVDRQRPEGVDDARPPVEAGVCSSCAPTRTPSSTPGSPRSSSTCRIPTVEIRPLRQMTGEAEFNEVFFSDTRIADAEMLGDPGDGWRVSLTTLMNERVSIGGTIPAAGFGHHLGARADVAEAAGVGEGPRCARRGDEAVGAGRGAAPHQHPREPEPQDGRSRAPRARSARWRRPTSTRTSTTRS